VKLSVAINDYGTSARHELGHAKTTYYCYSGRLMQFARWLAENGQPDPELHEISYDTIRRYYFSVVNQNVRPRTIRNHIHAIKALFAYYHKHGAMTENPAAEMKLPKLDPAQRKLVSDEDLAVLLEAAGKQASDYRCVRDKAILSVLIFCAIRRQELLDLRAEDVNLDNKVLVVQKGKGGKSRQVPLCKEVHQALVDWLAMRQVLKVKRDARLFTIPGGRSMGDFALAKMLREVIAIAGLKGEDRIQPHSIRHAGATRMLRNGMDLASISVWLGHSDLKTTAIYLHSDEQQIRQVAELAGFKPVPQQPPVQETQKSDRRSFYQNRRQRTAR
jgi:site-specific recombinase XerD